MTDADNVNDSNPGPDADTTRSFDPLGGPAARMIGRYELLESIGEGGMGEVWVARQTEPVKRKVALKLIKKGMDSRAVVQRFEQERQALAVMDHPNIAKVLDGGLTEAGQPYFVMELVAGKPLTAFCDDARLSLRDRLELFVPICQAVQHAHQKGVIHRDLKPSNILVTLVDGKPVPNVIDFGLAKAVSGKLIDESLSTHFGAVLGTLEYMAPEQAGTTVDDVDTRADIYSLGVILYELLTGLRPFDSRRVRRAAIDEVIRMIREEDPPSLASRLSTDESLASAAAVRATEPKRLVSAVKGELDWIARRCLEKDRNRRYETANGLARDVQRYLADEPVEARPVGAGYRFRKFLRRNKGPVIAVSLLLLALVGGVVGTTWGMFEANAARGRESKRAEGERVAKLDARVKEKLAIAAAEKERTARLEEERQRKFAEAISQFVQEDFLALTSVEGQDRFGGEGREALDRNTTLGQLLDRAAEKLRARKDLDPRIEAELCWMVGVNYVWAGEEKKGIEFLERAVQLRSHLHGRDHGDTLDAMNSLGDAYRYVGKLDLALPLHKETLDRAKAKLGPQHETTLISMNRLAVAYKDAGKLDLALPLLEETLKLRKAKFGPDHRDTLICMDDLGWAFLQAGKLDLALPLLEEALKLTKAKFGPEHLHVFASMNSLAVAYQKAGKLDLALPLCEQTLQMRKAKLGPDHRATLTSMNNLALAYLLAGKLDLALPLHEETLRLRKAKLGSEHSDTLTSMGNLAGAYQAAGKLDLALPLFEETLKLQKAKLGPEHPETLQSMTNLASAYLEARKPDLALPLFEETLKLQKGKLDPDHPNTLTTMNQLALAYKATGKLDLALPLFETTLKLRKAKLGPEHPETLRSMTYLAATYWQGKQLDKSVPLFEETLKRRIAMLGRDHQDTLTTLANLGVNYKDAGRLKEAIPLLEEAHRAAKKFAALRWVGGQLLDAYAKAGENSKFADLVQEQLAEARKALPKSSPQLAGMLAQIGSVLLEQKQWTRAEPLLRECLAIREKSQPDAWTTFSTKSMLGAALLGQKKYAEAEPLLNGYEGLKQREKSIPPQGATHIPEALDRLIDLYTATNKPDEVKKWKAERAKYPAESKPAAKGSDKPAEKK